MKIGLFLELGQTSGRTVRMKISIWCCKTFISHLSHSIWCTIWKKKTCSHTNIIFWQLLLYLGIAAMIDAMRISMIIRSSMVQIILGSNCSSSHLLKMYSTPRHLLGEILHIWSRTASFATIENVVSLGLLHT